ncbi:type I polyketide synthase [Streptomyces rugosispiralis]|uniref:Polyketide synthase dehydratase domain-containing protein n=1 Tax=Streptomyces rugosispiralis TaxID=2967341 RepID=A0ABT1VDE0_9ACTN|nr:type I polyketide synthase [Streptomyces rugosispiralis]MCQ8195307.1 polyketide synthase dehydratase domain-containing protein [Streptomyces rugosispiralis]
MSVTDEQSRRQPPVAIVGMSVLLPGSPDLDTYWRNLVGGVDAISDVPAGRWDAGFYAPDGGGDTPGAPDRVYCRRGGFVDEFARVEPARFGIMPNSVSGTEPDQLIALGVAAAAIADAGGEDRLPDRQRVGVVLGRGGYLTPGLVRLDQRVRTAHQLVRTLGELLPDLEPGQLDRVRAAFTERLGPDRPEAAIGLVPNLAASRIANRLDLRGPAYTVDAACASSLVAVDQAVGELASGRCDVMLAGGVHHCHDITLWSVFSQLRALSPSQRIRPFHRAADGLLIGEGTGVIVLKRLADALRDGDRVYAVIRGTGVASDGRATGLVNPDPGGQTRAVRQAWRAAGLDPREPGAIGLLEAHGTATPAGDAAELATLAEVFGPGGTPGETAVIGSVKSMIGHTMPAAGVAGLVKAALAVHHGRLLPTLHCDDPHPALAATRFSVLDAAEAWDAPVRRAAINAFGFGGINAHVVLEQPPSVPETRRATPSVIEPERVLALAADTPERLAELLAADDTTVRTTVTGRDARTRLGIVDPTTKRLALARRMVAKGRPWRGRSDIWFTPAPLLGAGGPAPRGKLAFVFPGLEAEFVPRVDGVAEYFGLSRPAGDRFREAARVGDIGRHGVGVFGVGRLLDAALRRMGVVPDAVAGHSVGEWTALAVGGLYAGEEVDAFLDSFDPDALRVPGLAFAVLGAGARRVSDALTGRADGRIVLSHDNAPGQSMVCGPRGDVEDFVRAMRAEGVIAQVLPFQSGFHTPMLAPYLDPIRAVTERFELLLPPRTPVWSGTTAAPYPATEAEVRELFIRHLLEPVRFRLLTEALYEAGFRAFVQVGTGQLGSLIGDTLQGRDHLVVAANSPHRDGVSQLRRVATALWAEGAEVDPALSREASGASSALPAVRLDLSGSLVSLGEPRLKELRDELSRAVPWGTGPHRGTRPPSPGAGRMVPARTAQGAPPGGGRGRKDCPPPSWTVELDALLSETAATATAVIAASRPPTPHTHRLRVSTETMPYLRDHCFFPQRPGWPDESDRWPVVPATTIVQHLMDTVERAAGNNLVAVAVHGARFDQWVTASPPTTVQVTATPTAGAAHYTATFGRSARATVEVAARHPGTRPARWSVDPATERAPDHTAQLIYAERWMFHGPAFQGLTRLTAIGASHIRGTITTPPVPGALLDNVGQLLGYWIMATRTERTVVFPVGMRLMRFFGPYPAPGTPVECLIRITSLTDTALEAEAQLLIGGEVWAELSGWQDRRFDNHPETRPVERFPQRNTLSRPQPGGWVLLHERWPDLASRDLIMRNHLGSDERAAYEHQPPRGRRQWLLGRIAAKDAVRRWLWDHGEGPVFPAEIGIREDAQGRPYAVGVHGRTLPELALSLAHRAETGVALVAPRHANGDTSPGIALEELTDDDDAAVALARPECELLAAVTAASGGSRARWATAFRVAKEAVATAEGSGLGERPRDLTIAGVRPGTDEPGTPSARLIVEVAATAPGQPPRRYEVHTITFANPPGLPDRDYAVAWTTGPDHQEQDEESDQ